MAPWQTMLFAFALIAAIWLFAWLIVGGPLP